jgi:hypothetical protein
MVSDDDDDYYYERGWQLGKWQLTSPFLSAVL